MSTQPISADSAVNAWRRRRSPSAGIGPARGAAGWCWWSPSWASTCPANSSLPPIDRDESRFAEASRRMAASADWHGWVVPMIQDTPRLNKPPLIYWLQAVSSGSSASGSTCTALAQRRHLGVSPAVDLGALLAALATWQLGHADVRPARRLCGGLAGGQLHGRDGRRAPSAPPTRCYSVSPPVAMSCPVVDLARPRSHALGLGAAALAGGRGRRADQGPVTPVLVVLTVLALCWVTWEWRWLGPTTRRSGCRDRLGVGVALGDAGGARSRLGDVSPGAHG